VRHQRHPAWRSAGQGYFVCRLSDPAHRPGAQRVAGRSRPARCPGVRRVERSVVGPARRCWSAGPIPRGRANRHVHDDLHLGDQWRAEGGAGSPSGRAVCRYIADRAIRGRRLRHLLSVDAAVSLQRATGRVERGGGLGWGHGPRDVLGIGAASRSAPIPSHLHELRGQTARIRPGHPRKTRRPRQPAARRVRQRGKRSRHRRVQSTFRLHGVGRLRLHRGRDHHHSGGRLPAGFAGAVRVSASTTPTRSPNAPWPSLARMAP
jgi:hypothetical protein